MRGEIFNMKEDMLLKDQENESIDQVSNIYKIYRK